MLGVGLDDPRFDAAAIRRAALDATPLPRVGTGEDQGPLERAFGPVAAGDALLRVRDGEQVPAWTVSWQRSDLEAGVVRLLTALDGTPERAIVQVTTHITSWIDETFGRLVARHTDLEAYVALRTTADGWRVEGREFGAAGRHHLRAAVDADGFLEQPEADAALLALAADDAGPSQAPPGVSQSDDPEHVLCDLALADGRFAPDVVAAAARRVFDHWSHPEHARRLDGLLADPRALDGIGPGWFGRHVEDVVVREVRAQRTPPEVALTLVLAPGGRRLRWTMVLADEDPAQPWKLLVAG